MNNATLINETSPEIRHLFKIAWKTVQYFH